MSDYPKPDLVPHFANNFYIIGQDILLTYD